MSASVKHLSTAFLYGSLVWAGLWASPVLAGGTYKPFIAAAPAGTAMDEAVKNVKAKLNKGNFEIVGEDSPYGNGAVRLIGVTNSDLKRAASRHATGGFGAVMRVAVTNNKGVIEVSYTNPSYLGIAYNIGDLSSVDKALSAALGGGESFGSKGLSQQKLAKYHYMATMPEFKDAKKVASFPSHAAAVAAIEKAMKQSDSDMRAIWQVKVSSDQTLFGVRLDGGPWRGQIQGIMDKIDIATPKSSAALPWEILVSGKDVYYLPGKYRIALMFPDLTMQQFLKISTVPDMMERSAEELVALAGMQDSKEARVLWRFLIDPAWYRRAYQSYSCLSKRETPVMPPTTDDADDGEIVDIFVEEAEEVLQSIDRNLAVWRQRPTDSNALAGIRRVLPYVEGERPDGQGTGPGRARMEGGAHAQPGDRRGRTGDGPHGAVGRRQSRR